VPTDDFTQIDTKGLSMTLAEKIVASLTQSNFDETWLDRIIDQGTSKLTHFFSQCVEIESNNELGWHSVKSCGTQTDFRVVKSFDFSMAQLSNSFKKENAPELSDSFI
jgi:hypothetical protein